MIKFEHNTLVLNSIFSREDVDEIDRFADYIRQQEQERIIKLLEELAEVTDYVEIRLDSLIALIKGEQK